MSLDIPGKGRDDSLRPGLDDRLAAPLRVVGHGRSVRDKLLGPVLLVCAWFAASGLRWVDPTTLPSPQQTWSAAVGLLASGQLQQHLLISVQRALIGLLIGVVVGLVFALLAGLSRIGEMVLDSNLQMLRSMPILALVPLAIVWFGIGEEIKVILVALGVLFPIYLNTHTAIRSIDSRYVDLAITSGLSRMALVRRVILPGSLPGFFTGLRFSVAIAWLVLVVSEQINASSGIGYLMTQARSVGQTDVIVVGLIVYALLGLASDTFVRFFERKALTWRSTLQAH